MKLIKKIKRRIVTMGVLSALGFFLKILTQKVFSLYYSRLFKTANLKIGRYSNIVGRQYITIGKAVSLGRFCWLEAVTQYYQYEYHPEIVIGNQVSASDFLHVAAINKIIIGNGVLIGSKVLITDHNHGCYSEAEQSSPEEIPQKRILYSSGPVIIEDNVFIGDNVVILNNVKIGYGSVIGANVVVTKDIPPYTIVTGYNNELRFNKVFDQRDRKWKKLSKI
jgi:acetyltransferase-like isoleucine patch superfamily enzyme